MTRQTPLVILHVEDHSAHAELIREGFRGHRIEHRIHHVTTGPEALYLAIKRPDPPVGGQGRQ